MDIAYVSYAAQSGVTAQVTHHLEGRGHTVIPIQPVGPLEFRGPSGARRVTRENLRNLAVAFSRYGKAALAHRWNTPFAFDRHSAEVDRLLDALPDRPDVVLQNGALFAPRRRSDRGYVLYCDHTRMLAMDQPEYPAAGLPAPLDYGPEWHCREVDAYRSASAVLTFSKHTAESVTEHYGVPPARVRVVGAGANVFPERVERRDDGETVVFIGKEFERKGGRVLLEAFAMLRRRRPGASLLVAGPRQLEGARRGVELLGEIPFAEVPPLLARATVFCMPSLREPFGLAFLDALACGVPCVGTRVDAIPEIVEEGVTGAVVAPNDPRALAEALERLLSDRDRARSMGLVGRERVKALWRWEHVAARIERVLAEVVADHSRPAARAAG